MFMLPEYTLIKYEYITVYCAKTKVKMEFSVCSWIMYKCTIYRERDSLKFKLIDIRCASNIWGKYFAVGCRKYFHASMAGRCM